MFRVSRRPLLADMRRENMAAHDGRHATRLYRNQPWNG
jgi:hypothetical protein